MSAVNPLSASDTAADKRPYEPSMEEILASIRRIIADDQTLPGKSSLREAEVPTSLHEPVAAPTPFPSPRDELAAPKAPEPHSEPVARMPEPQVHPQNEPLQDAQARAPEPEATREAAPVTEFRAHGVFAAPQFAAPPRPAVEEPVPPALQVLRQAPPPPEAAAPPAPAPADVENDDEMLYDEAIEPDPAPLHLGDDVSTPAPNESSALFSSATDTSISSAFNMLAASRLADNSDELMNLAREMIRPLLRAWIDDNLPSMVERMVRAEIERVARGGR